MTNLSTQFLISFRYIFEFNYKNSFERKIIFSQIFDHIKENDSLDHFFGKIFDNHELNNENIILWLFEYNLNFKTKKFYKKKSLLKNKEYRFIQKLNTPLDIISILVIYVKLLNSYRIIAKKLPSIEIDGLKSKLLPREYFCFLVNGFLPLKELLIYNAFNKIIKFNNNLDTIIYPYEEKTIERAIILSARKNKSKITTIGYCHSVHWNLHYWYHIRKDPIANSPRPNIYLVTGPYEKYWLNKIAKVPKEKIKIIGSNRYVEKKYPFPESIFEKNILKILVTVGQASDMNILANYVEDQIDIFKQCHLLIRKYPFSWIIEQNAGISRIKNHVKNITISNTESLESQIEWSDIILYNSSSCGIIGMLSGRISINVALHDILYWDPFEKRGSKNSVIHCSSASELKKIIHNLRTLNSKRYEIIQKKQYSYAKNVYAPLEDDVIFELLSKNSFTKN